jgi:hypothetical protein
MRGHISPGAPLQDGICRAITQLCFTLSLAVLAKQSWTSPVEVMSIRRFVCPFVCQILSAPEPLDRFSENPTWDIPTESCRVITTFRHINLQQTLLCIRSKMDFLCILQNLSRILLKSNMGDFNWFIFNYFYSWIRLTKFRIHCLSFCVLHYGVLQQMLRSRKRGYIHPFPHTPSWRST